MYDLFEQYNWNDNRKVLTFKEMLIPCIRNFGYNQWKTAIGPLTTHYHKNIMEIVYIINGVQNFNVGDDEYTVSGGNIFITFPNEVHSTGHNPQAVSEFFWLQVELEKPEYFLGLSEPWDSITYNKLVNLKNRIYHIDPHYGDVISNSFYNLASNNPDEKNIGHNCLLYFLNTFFKHPGGSNSAMTPDIKNTLKYIDDHICDKIIMTDLMKISNLCESRFKIKFRSQLGITPMEYINYLKIEKSKELLRNNSSITDVSFELGFSSSSYFSVMFKKFTSLTPTEFLGKKL